MKEEDKIIKLNFETYEDYLDWKSNYIKSLEIMLNDAIYNEDYEKAGDLRDDIISVKYGNHPKKK